MSGGSVVRRAWRRLLRSAVEGLGVSPRRVGYRHLPRSAIEEAAAEVRRFDDGWTRDDPLPANADRIDDLDPATGVSGLSFRESPRRRMEPTFAARLDDARVVRDRDRFGNASYALVTADDRVAGIPGTTYRPGHAAALRGAPAESLDAAVWLLDRSFGNYFHWLVDVLPKLSVVEALGLEGRILVPRRCGIQPIVDASLELLGLDEPRLHRLTAEVHAVRRLWVVRAPRFHDRLLRAVRDRLVAAVDPAPGPARRVYVSRAGAGKRRLLDEPDLVRDLEDRGFEIVAPEAWSLAEQIAAFARTRVVVSVHGAGLANALFMPPGSDVVEISPEAHPNPVFYALASALGHRYWIVPGRAAEGARGRHADLRVDRTEIASVLEAIGSDRPARRAPGGG